MNEIKQEVNKMNTATLDPIEILFGNYEATESDKAEFAAAELASIQKAWSRARNFRPELRGYNENVIDAEQEMIAELAELSAKREVWIAKTYKSNSKKITFGDIDDDRDDMPKSYTIEAINEKRRARHVENLTASMKKVIVALAVVNSNTAELAKTIYNL